jgi:arylsulfatase A-like enzyme
MSLTRREWIAGASSTAAVRGAGDSRPNLLYIMTDQQCADAIGALGCGDVRTPAMDSLVRSGVVFREAYCSNPLCVPARTSMLTGRMPHESGVTTNNMKVKPVSDTFLGRIFTDAGYDCGYFGKWHVPVPVADVARHGFETIAHTAGNGVDTSVPPASIEFLRRKRTRPFLLVSSFVNPHDICEWARGTAGKDGPYVDPPPPAQCPELPANFEIPEHEPDIIRDVQARDRSAYPTRGWPADRWRQYRYAYYRLIERVDAHIGAILDALRETGQDSNTVVIFASDHGDGNASHRWNQKQLLYEETARVPFVVSWKGRTKAGHVDSKHLVNTCIDLIPTLCDYAGIAAPRSLKGLSLRALAAGKAPRRWRDVLVSETELCANAVSHGVRGRMLRTGDLKYVIYSEGNLREQLFNLRTDRGEMRNLAVERAHASALADCRRRLAGWCREHGDPFEVPVPDAPVRRT